MQGKQVPPNAAQGATDPDLETTMSIMANLFEVPSTTIYSSRMALRFLTSLVVRDRVSLILEHKPTCGYRRLNQEYGVLAMVILMLRNPVSR